VRRLLAIGGALFVSACVTVGTEQRERIAGYKARQSREFVSRVAEGNVDPKQADLVAIVTAEAINLPLKRLEQHPFPVGGWEFVPSHAPEVELNTGSAFVRVAGRVRQVATGRVLDVTLVGGLTTRWSADGAHLYLTPSALAVVPTLNVSVLDFAMGSFLRQFAESQAQVYLAERIREIDVPVQLMFPIHRGAIALDHKLQTPDNLGATLRYELPEASAQVQIKQLYVWPLEGKLLILAYSDVMKVTPIMPPSAGQP
jgi:hypothetical protein